MPKNSIFESDHTLLLAKIEIQLPSKKLLTDQVNRVIFHPLLKYLSHIREFFHVTLPAHHHRIPNTELIAIIAVRWRAFALLIDSISLAFKPHVYRAMDWYVLPKMIAQFFDEFIRRYHVSRNFALRIR